MSCSATYSKLGHLVLKKETTAGTAVYPDTFLEILSEDPVINWEHTASEAIAGNRSKNLNPIKNKIEPIEGTIEMLVEPSQHGHFLTGAYGEATDTTLEALLSFQHDFEPQNTLKTYTMDVKAGGENYVTRYFGVRIASKEYSLNENKLTASIGIMAQRAFSNARITTAASSGTALEVDQTSGLTTSDTIVVLDKDDPTTEIAEYTITSITDENNLVVSTISDSLEVDDIVVIKPQTPSYDLSNEFIWSGGAQVAIANGAHGVQNLSDYVNLEGFTLTTTNEFEARHAATGTDVVDRFPSCIVTKGVTVEGAINQLHQSPEFLDMLRENEQVTLRIEFLGTALASNVAAAASATIETDGTDTLTVTVDSAGEAGNDYAIVFTTGNGSLTAGLSGKLITVNLDATGANNTTTLVAAAIDGLSGVSCSDTGTDLVDTASNLSKIHFASGRDANEVEKLRFDIPDVRLKPFNANLGNDDVLQEDIDFVAYRDDNDDREIQVRLRNSVSDY